MPAMAGSVGRPSGEQSVKVMDKVAVSPYRMVSRSSEVSNLGALQAGETTSSKPATTSPTRVHSGLAVVFHANRLIISKTTDFRACSLPEQA